MTNPLFTTYSMHVRLRDRASICGARLAVKAVGTRLAASGRELGLQNRIVDLRTVSPALNLADRQLVEQMRSQETYVYVDHDALTLHLRHVSDAASVGILMALLARNLERFAAQWFFLETQASNELLPQRTFFALNLADVETKNVLAQIDDAISRLPNEGEGMRQRLREMLSSLFVESAGLSGDDRHRRQQSAAVTPDPCPGSSSRWL